MQTTQNYHSYYKKLNSVALVRERTIPTVTIRTLFQLSYTTQRKIAVRHYPAIFIVCRGVSVAQHFSIRIFSGYGFCVFRVAYFEWAPLSKF